MNFFLLCPHTGSVQECGGGKAWTADPNCPKGYSIPCDVMFSTKAWGKEKEG